jgi:hypothetical protein
MSLETTVSFASLSTNHKLFQRLLGKNFSEMSLSLSGLRQVGLVQLVSLSPRELKIMANRTHFHSFVASLAMMIIPGMAFAQSAGTSVDVGPGHANASGQAQGQWQHVDTESRVGNGHSMGRALAIGSGPNGIAISHSIGLNGRGTGVAHNFNMSLGRNGMHVSHGNVSSQGGNSRVIAGGNAGQSPWGDPQGGSTVGGFGRNTRAFSNSRTIPVGSGHPFGRSGGRIGRGFPF